MRNTFFVTMLLLSAIPAAGAAASDAGSEVDSDRLVLSLRADLAQIHSHGGDFFVYGGSLGVHVPFGDLPVGLSLSSSLAGGDGHLVSTSDIGLRYYLPSSGPAHGLQPYVRGGAALSFVHWEAQDTTTTIGGVLGIGLQWWVTEIVGLDFEVSYRVMGGDELRQALHFSLGFAFGT